MSLFDYIKFKYPLPLSDFQNETFQTKSFRYPFLINYKVDKDGQLWREYFDTEDRSDPSAAGIFRVYGCLARINERWEKELFDGEVNFYTLIYPENEEKKNWWIEFLAIFEKGIIKNIKIIENRQSNSLTQKEQKESQNNIDI